MSVALAATAFLLVLVWLASSMHGFQYLRSRRAATDMRWIAGYLREYHAIHHAYPAAANIDELRRQLPGRAIIPNGPWGHPYTYVTSPDYKHYRLISEGRDGTIERRFLIIKSLPPQRTTSSWDDDIVLQDGRLIQIHEELGQQLR